MRGELINTVLPEKVTSIAMQEVHKFPELQNKFREIWGCDGNRRFTMVLP